MVVEMEGLEFPIETTADEGTKGIDALVKSFEKLKNITKGGLGLSSSVEQLEKLDAALKKFDTSKLEGVGKALESVSKLGEVEISGSVAEQLGNIADAIDRITPDGVERLESMGEALHNLGEVGNVRVPNIGTQASGAVTDAATPTAGAADSGITQATSSVQEVSAAMNEVTQQTISFRSILSSIGGVFQKGFSLGAGVLHNLGNALNKVASAAGKAVQNLLGFNKTSAGIAAHTKHVTSGLGQLFNSIKRIAMYRLIRSALSAISKAFKEGVNNLYQYSNMLGGQFAMSMNSVATNALYLKNSLGAMAAPIINALAPAIDYLSSKIVNLLNLINMLIARLTGSSTYTAAKKISTSYGDAFDSAAGSAKKAADKIKSYTTGIDELNIIQETPDNNSGGGGSGTDYGSMFEELPINNQISDFADRLREAFDNANWKTLGTLIGTKVNEVIDSIDYNGIGKKIGFGLDGAIQTAYYFLDSVNFTNIGTKIAEFLNGAIENIDWNVVGRLFRKVSTWSWLIDAIIGGIQGLDWKLIGNSIGDFLVGACDEATDWISQYDWGQLGTDLWGKIKTVVTNIDWGAVVSSIAEALGSAFGGLVSLRGSFLKGVWEDISAYFSGKIEECGGDIPAGLLKGIKDALGDVCEWIKTNIADPFVEGFKNLFDIHSPSTVMEAIGKFITEGLLNGILAPFKAIEKWVENHIVQPLKDAFGKTDLAEFTVGVKNTASTWWSNVKTWWSGKVGTVKEFTTSVKNDSATWWSNVKTWWSGKVGTLSVGVSIINAASTWWSNVKTWWSNVAGSLSTTLNIKVPKVEVKWSTVTVFGKDYSYPSGFNLKWNAKGGILDGAQIFGMMGNTLLGGGEAGREAVLPLDTHTEWMDTLAQKVRDGLPGEGNGGGYTEFRRALEDFYSEYVQPTMNQMAADMQRQANKKEQATIQIGNRTITDAVTAQQDANGYRFAK